MLQSRLSPQATLVIPNLGSALREEGQWKFPDEFNPENFLNDKGEFVKPEAFLCFSAGKPQTSCCVFAILSHQQKLG